MHKFSFRYNFLTLERVLWRVLTVLQELNTCLIGEGYYTARCLNFDAPGGLSTALQSITTNPAQTFYIQTNFKEPDPPTCSINGSGYLIAFTVGNAAGCVPNYDFSFYRYTECNETAGYTYTCSDYQCSQDCVIETVYDRTYTGRPRKSSQYAILMDSLFLVQQFLVPSPIVPKSPKELASTPQRLPQHPQCLHL
jgi:hypothetical protein